MKKLPLAIDTQIYLRSADQKGIKTVSRILGARHGDFILIEEPVFRINERLFASPDQFVCSFSDEGEVYFFYSKIQKTIGRGLTFIDYPEDFQVETVRKHHRIQVNLEVALYFEVIREQVKGTIRDISEGGCFVSLPVLITVGKNMKCKADFTLPDNQIVAGLLAEARQVQFFKLRKSMDVGLEFVGPPDELRKIQSFCQFCMFFKV